MLRILWNLWIAADIETPSISWSSFNLYVPVYQVKDWGTMSWSSFSIIELASSVYLRYKMNELIYSIEFYSFLFNCQINLLPQRLLQEAQLINARLQVALYRKLFRYDLHELRPGVRLLALQGSIVGWFTIAFRENWEESCFFTMSLFTELHFHLQISLKFIDFLYQML